MIRAALARDAPPPGFPSALIPERRIKADLQAVHGSQDARIQIRVQHAMGVYEALTSRPSEHTVRYSHVGHCHDDGFGGKSERSHARTISSVVALS